MKEKIKIFNYYWDLIIPLGMALTAIWYGTPFSKMFIWAGWLVFVLHITLFGQIKGTLWDEIPTNLPYFFIRIPLVLLIPTFNDFLTIKDYFYTEVLAETISLLFIMIFMLLFHKKKDGERFVDDVGWFTLFLILGFIGCSLFPFIAEIYLHFKNLEGYSWIYIVFILATSLYFHYQLFSKIVNEKLDIQNNHRFNDFMLIPAIFGWFIILSILYLFKNGLL